MIRARICFHKTEAMRFTGHLDLHHTWERTLRRASLPLAYSQGFHPQPRLNLAAALPLGFTSEAEVIDAWFEQDLSPDDLTQALQPALPPGIRLISISLVDLKEPALQTQVRSASYRITLLDPAPDLDTRIKQILEADSIPRQRRNKDYDLRPLIEKLMQIDNDEINHQRIEVQLSAREGATGRPEELLSTLGLDPFAARVHRFTLYFALQ